MALTPDEIARRPFTPSVDGYHQGEVREFLQRVANQLQAIHNAQPEGRAELAELSLAMADHEPRLLRLEHQLTSIVQGLGDATQQAHKTQSAAAAQLVAAKQLTAGLQANSNTVDAPLIERLLQEQQTLIAAADKQRALVDQLNADRKATTDQLASITEQLAGFTQSADDQHAATSQLTAAINRLPNPAAGPASSPAVGTAESAPPPVTAESFSAASAWALGDDEIASGDGPAEDVIYTDPIDGTPVSAAGTHSASTPATDPGLVASDFAQDPLYSDNANDQLDGVLDDVMGNLNDEGNPAS